MSAVTVIQHALDLTVVRLLARRAMIMRKIVFYAERRTCYWEGSRLGHYQDRDIRKMARWHSRTPRLSAACGAGNVWSYRRR